MTGNRWLQVDLGATPAERTALIAVIASTGRTVSRSLRSRTMVDQAFALRARERQRAESLVADVLDRSRTGVECAVQGVPQDAAETRIDEVARTGALGDRAGSTRGAPPR